jgi:hypothetical protein
MVGVSTMTGSLSVALIVWPPRSTTVRKVARKARRGPAREQLADRNASNGVPRRYHS